MIHKFDPMWGSHIVPLIKCLENTYGPVLELGMGISSTPILHAMCADQDRYLRSLDNEPKFIEMFKKYRTDSHDIQLITDWDSLPPIKWSVVLVDHKPDNRRAKEARKFVDADYVILHDTEPDKNDLYHYDEIYPHFKYRFDYTKFKVHTTVLSNHYDFNLIYNS